jgi:hypothetical protein
MAGVYDDALVEQIEDGPAGELLEDLYAELGNRLIAEGKERQPAIEAKMLRLLFVEALERGMIRAESR